MGTELKLYEIAPEFAQLVEKDDLTEDDMQRLDDLGHALEVKADNIASVTDKLEAFVELCKSEEQRISSRRRAVESRISWVKKYLQDCMETAGVYEIEIGTRKIALQKNPPKVVVDDEEQIPNEYFVVIPAKKQLDKKTLKDALKKEYIPGARLEQELSLRKR